MNKTNVLKIIGVLVLALGVGAVGFRYFNKARMQRIPETNLFSLGQVAASQGDFKKAVEYYQILLSKDPRHAIALEFLVDSQEKMGDLKGAIVSSERLLELERSPRYVQKMISLYRKDGQEDRAKALEEVKESP